MTSGAWRKTFPLLAMASALHTKSKVLTAALSAGWTSAHQELRIATQIKNQNKSKRKRNIKEIWGFGGEWKPTASPSNLQLGSGPVHLVLIATGNTKKTKTKKTKLDTNLLKNTRTSVLKTHSRHTQLSCLSPPTSSFVILSFDTDNWTDIWTFLFFFFFFYHRDPLKFLLSLSSSFSSFIFFLLAHFLWVGSTNTLLISDSLAYQILCCLCSGWRPCYGNFTVPSARNELSFFGDLDAGSS